MRFNNQQGPISYLQSILLNGSRPFLYRSRIYLLLGLVDNQMKRQNLSMTLSPTYFPYMSDQFPYKSFIPKSTENEFIHSTITSSIDKERNNNLRFNNYFPNVKDGTHNDVAQDKSGSKSFINDTHTLHDTIADIRPTINIKSSGRNPRQREHQEIISDNSDESNCKSQVPELSTKNDSDLLNQLKTLPKTITTMENNIPHISQSVQDNFVREEIETFPKEKNSTKTNNPFLAEVTQANKNQKAQNTKANTLNTISIDKEIIVSPTIGAGQSSQVTSTFNEDDVSADSVYNRPVFTRKIKLPIPNANKAEYNADERIEQLRCLVHQLISKIHSNEVNNSVISDGQEDKETKPILPRPEKIVIVKQSPRRAKTLHAFWERNHLSHFQLRFFR